MNSDYFFKSIHVSSIKTKYDQHLPPACRHTRMRLNKWAMFFSLTNVRRGCRDDTALYDDPPSRFRPDIWWKGNRINCSGVAVQLCNLLSRRNDNNSSSGCSLIWGLSVTLARTGGGDFPAISWNSNGWQNTLFFGWYLPHSCVRACVWHCGVFFNAWKQYHYYFLLIFFIHVRIRLKYHSQFSFLV